MPIIFGGIRTVVLGAIKAQLPYSDGKCQLLNSWNKIPLPTVFYHLNFQLPHPNRSNSGSSQKCHPSKRPQNDTSKVENCTLSLFPFFFLVGCL